MILRRITEHVKAQNWTAVALDFFIVVVGVFIGIQVANWNEARADTRRADDLMTRMVSEAMTARSEMSRYIEVHQEISGDAARLPLALKDKASCMAVDDEVLILILSIADFPPPRFSLANAEQALSTGSLSLIQSTSIRASIQTITDEMVFVDRQWQRYIRVKQDANREAQKAAGVSLTGRGEMEVVPMGSYDPISYELLTPEKICGNTEIIGLTTNVAVLQTIYVDYLGQVARALDDYIATLSEETST